MTAAPRTPATGATMAYVFLAFAAAYLLSYAYRTVNAVISPELTRELALDPASLGLLTSAYFLAFGAMQVPAGMLLDRFGPRRVEPVLLSVAACGALLFAWSDSLTGLLIGRAVIGLGVAVCLMAPLKGFAVWYAADRQASLAGSIMIAGGLGALATTAPLEFALRFVGWRAVFYGLAAVTFLVALIIALRVPDTPRPEHALGFRSQFSGVRRVFANPRFWWLAPLASIGMGSFMAVQGLWAVPWLMETEGLTRAAAAERLLAMSIVVLVGYVCLGAFSARLARRGIKTRHLFIAGFGLNGLALAAIVAHVPGSFLWWLVYGLGACVNVLGFTVLNEGFPRELAARVNTALNLLMFSGSFLMQWGIGVLVEALRVRAGLAMPAALQAAFTLVACLDAVALTWFASRWRRHARVAVPAVAGA